ncbi:MAG: hypothetical protein PHW69_05670 [Elusimicrobiaceae bacterium]|nr:hypothetical protein [Elusimicrobiaceae bacterium]
MIRVPAEYCALLADIGACARDKGTSAWAVGGCVRDWALGLATRDLDILTEGPAEALAGHVAARHGLEWEKFGRFGTCRLTLPDGTGMDFARARTETYAKPAALPEVEFSTVEHDLRRRDFTVNAAAMNLLPGAFGAVLDPFNAISDAAAGQLRVLHDRSFEDDPTRLYRLIRFAGRFGWAAGPETLVLAKNALTGKYPARLSKSRLGRELLCILNERAAKAVFANRLADELFGYMGEGIRWYPALERLEPDESGCAQEDSIAFDYERLGVLACSMPDGALFLKSLGLRRELCAALVETAAVCAMRAAPENNLSRSQKRIIRAVFPDLADSALKRRFVRGRDIMQYRIIGPQVARLITEYAQLQWQNRFIDRPAALAALKERFRPARFT